MEGHCWKDPTTQSGILVCSECGEWCWSEQYVKGYYRMQARDSATGIFYSWIAYGPEPDYGGTGWPGPSKPENVSVIERRTFPITSSCDEYLISEIMDS